MARGEGAARFCPETFRGWRDPQDVALWSDEQYRGEVSLVGEGDVADLDITPNRVRAAVSAPAPTRLVVNQHSAPGWRSSAGPVVPHQGLLAGDLPARESLVEFRYSPPGLPAGTALSAGTLAACGLAAWRRRKAR